MKPSATAAAAVVLLAAGAMATPANATFQADPNPGGVKMYIDVANHDAASFTGYVGANNSSQPHIAITATGNVDTGSGYANIKPVKNGTLSDLIFDPANDTLFNGFSFRGQMAPAGFPTAGPATINVQWTDSAGSTGTVSFDISKPNQDFGRLGIYSTDGETLKSLALVATGGTSFKEVKQIDFSDAGASPPPSSVPEPASLAILGFGAAALLMRGRRRFV